jgi:DNA (cytosine-5)-methyltransferase 1
VAILGHTLKFARAAPADCEICTADAAFLRGSRPAYEALRPAVRLVDLFAGCGGLTLGLAEAARRCGLGIEVRLAIDADPHAVTVYGNNFPHANIRQGLVEELLDGALGAALTLTERKLRQEVQEVDVLVGGPPCQGHSDLNNHTRRADPRNGLYTRMARATEVLRPSVVFIENVPTVLHDVERVLYVTKDALEKSGYAVADKVVDLATLGAPQRRRRHVILALRGRRSNAQVVLDGLEVRCPQHPERTVRWAIADLLTEKSDALFKTASVPTTKNARRIRYLFDENEYDLPNNRRPVCHRSDHSYRSMYGRLKWTEPAQTVTTGFGSMGQGRYVHPSRRRTITPHEAARLQMLPDFMDFTTVKTRVSLARLIGNAVPPALGIAIGEKVLPTVARNLGWEQ